MPTVCETDQNRMFFNNLTMMKLHKAVVSVQPFRQIIQHYCKKVYLEIKNITKIIQRVMTNLIDIPT